jgi:hypothetical protein
MGGSLPSAIRNWFLTEGMNVMRRVIACLTMAGALIAGGVVMAPVASAEDHYLREGHYYSMEECEARGTYLITTQPWNYYDYFCTDSYTLFVAYYA